MLFPTVPKSVQTEDLGVELVDRQVRALKHIFRPKTRADIGIDGEIELLLEKGYDRQGTGRLIAVQIKAGPSYLENEVGDAYRYRGANKHLGYWIDHSIPVLILLCDLETDQVHWVEVTPGAITRHEKSWTILVPKANVLGEAQWALEQIADRNRIDAVVDLCVQAWFHASRPDRIEFAGIQAMPRDYHWYRHLIRIGDRQVMLHWLYARYGVFELDDLKEALTHLKGNAIYGEELILCFVAESREAFAFPEGWQDLCDAHDKLRTVQLIFDRDWPEIGELQSNGQLVVEYYRGRPA